LAALALAALGTCTTGGWGWTGKWAATGGTEVGEVMAHLVGGALLASSRAGAKRGLVCGVILGCSVGVQGSGVAGAASVGAGVSCGVLRAAFWNARHMCAAAGDAKRWWLAEQIDMDKPVIVGVCEVEGNFHDMVKMRRWAQRAGYDMRFLPGEGRGGAEGAGDSRAKTEWSCCSTGSKELSGAASVYMSVASGWRFCTGQTLYGVGTQCCMGSSAWASGRSSGRPKGTSVTEPTEG